MSERHPLHDKIKRLPLFEGFTDVELDEFLAISDPAVHRAGDLIIRQGEVGECMYYIAQGTCSVLANRGGHHVELARLGPGEVFGELAIFDKAPRSATVQAVTDCVLVSVTGGLLNALATILPGAAYKFLVGILREIGDRLRKTNVRYLDSVIAQPPQG
ncbi:MAG: cyclic nucleotide-binding domain-containing protein [Chthoniobacteraceae bacterium]